MVHHSPMINVAQSERVLNARQARLQDGLQELNPRAQEFKCVKLFAEVISRTPIPGVTPV